MVGLSLRRSMPASSVITVADRVFGIPIDRTTSIQGAEASDGRKNSYFPAGNCLSFTLNSKGISATSRRPSLWARVMAGGCKNDDDECEY